MGQPALDNSGEMDIKQAAKYVSESLRRPYSAKTLYNRISEGQGPRHLKKFGRLVFLAADIDAWIKSNTVVMKAFGR